MSSHFYTLLIFFACSSGSLFAQQTIDGTFMHDGEMRSYILYLPANLPDNAPLVFNLHGYGSNATQQQFYAVMNPVANENLFAVCYPQGSKDVQNTDHWNAGLFISDTDDVGFLTALANSLQSEYALDPERTFACGMSNGGFMSYYLACNAPETFKAIASVTGTMTDSNINNCSPTIPVPVLEIHGTADPIVPYNGTDNVPGWGDFVGSEAVIDFWTELNECSTFIEEDLPDTAPNDLSTVTSRKYTDCASGNRVWLYTINNGGHEWPGAFFGTANQDINASELIWEFFELASSPLVSSKQIEDQAVRLSPNPTHGRLHIQQVNQLSSIVLFSVSGKKMASLPIIEEQQLPILPSGIYFLQMQKRDGTLQVEKIVYQQ